MKELKAVDKDKLMYELKERASSLHKVNQEQRVDEFSSMLSILFTAGVLDSGETEEIRGILDGDGLDG